MIDEMARRKAAANAVALRIVQRRLLMLEREIRAVRALVEPL